MDKKIKIAVIGVGKWGKTLLKEFSLQADILYVCHNGSKETKEFLDENYPNIKSTDSLNQMLSDITVDAVVIATPTTTHREIALQAIEAGKHVFLEKPGGNNSTELKEITDAARKKGVILAIGYEMIFHPAWIKIMERLPSESIESIHMGWFKWGSFTESVITNLLCHDVSLLLSLNREIKTVNNSVYGVVSSADIVEAKFTSNTFQATCYINRTSPEKRRVITVTGKNEILIWEGEKLSLVNMDTKTLEPVEITSETAVALEIKDLLNSIIENRTPRASGEFALSVFNTLETILK